MFWVRCFRIDVSASVILMICLAAPAGKADFNVGDLAGPWQLHGLISGDSPDQNPGWFWLSLEFDTDGNASPTSTVHDSLGNTDYLPSLQGFSFDRFGHVTYETIGDFRGITSIEKDLMLATVTLAPGAYEDVRGYNLHIYTRGGSGFTTADLAGTWRLHGLIAGDEPQFTSWMYGTLTAGADGTFSFSIHDTEGPNPETGSGRASLTNEGIFRIQDKPSSHGVMSSDKSLVLFTMDDSGGGASLSLMQRHSAATFSDGDLTGLWHVHGLTTGDAPQWTGWFRGDMEVRSSGAFAVTFVRSDGSVRVTDTMHISNDGVVTVVGISSAHGVMSDDKNLIVLTMTDGGGGYDLVILSRASATLSSYDYGVGTAEEYGVKTFEWTYGRTGEWTSQIAGTVTVQYGDSSSLTGVEITNVVEVNGNLWNEVVCADGSLIKALALGDFYLSSDEHLTSHPDVWSFGTMTDGMLLDMRTYYVIRRDDPNQAIAQDNQMLLYHVQDVNVLHGSYADATTSWTIDTRYPFVEVNLLGRGADLGLVLPTALETGGYAVTGFRIRGRNTGVIGLGRIDPQTGQLQYLGELKERVADEVLFEDDFGDGVADGWNEVLGTWAVTNNEYVGTVGGYDDTLIATAGDPSWSSYTINARIKASFAEGMNDFGFIFYAQDPNNYLRFTIGGEDTPQPRISHHVDLESVAELATVTSSPPIVNDQWYQVRLVLCRDNASAYVDGQLVAYASGLPFIQGYFGLIADDPVVYFDDIQVTAGANVFFPDYMPLDPNEHGTKTFEWTYGGTGEYTSAIAGEETVPYGSGAIKGVTITNHSDWGTMIVSSDGASVRFLGGGEWYLSTDTSLSAPPSGYVFGALTDGMIIDQGEHYNVKKDLSNWERVDDQMLLISIQDITVPQGDHENAVVIWYLDTNFAFTPLDFHAKESELGLTLPSSADTGGYAATAVEIYALGTGQIAQADIDAATGSLNNLAELKEIAGAPPDSILHDWNGDGIISIIGDVPPFVNCVYFQNCPDWPEERLLAVGDCNHDGILSIIGDVPCFVNCVYFEVCGE